MAVIKVESGVVVQKWLTKSLATLQAQFPADDLRESDAVCGQLIDGSDVVTDPVIPIADRRAAKNSEIDRRTREIINEGFTYDTVVFSLSDNAQRYWVALRAQVTSGSLVSADFPFEISTLADGAYSLLWANFDAFIDTAFTNVETPLASGRAIKQTVNASNDPENVADNR